MSGAISPLPHLFQRPQQETCDYGHGPYFLVFRPVLFELIHFVYPRVVTGE
jgi:hypothetical protein